MADNQQLITTEYQPPAESNIDLPAVDEENADPGSIWAQDKFPSKTRPIEFTPQQLKAALVEFSNTITPIDEVLENNSITVNTFYRIIGLYPEINETYLAAQRLKSRKYGQTAQDMWRELPNKEEFYTYDRSGNKCLSAAGVRYLEVKSGMMLRFAQIHETGSYVPASKQETINRNLNVSVSAKLPTGFDLASASLEDMIDVIKGRKRV